MSKKINTKKPVRFYDDRGKDKIFLYIKKILYEDNKFCLCQFKGDFESNGPNNKTILFKKDTGEVLNGAYDAWYAENYKNLN
jgi:hypothetical protein